MASRRITEAGLAASGTGFAGDGRTATGTARSLLTVNLPTRPFNTLRSLRTYSGDQPYPTAKTRRTVGRDDAFSAYGIQRPLRLRTTGDTILHYRLHWPYCVEKLFGGGLQKSLGVFKPLTH
jgi:hypothetical protein